MGIFAKRRFEAWLGVIGYDDGDDDKQLNQGEARRSSSITLQTELLATHPASLLPSLLVMASLQHSPKWIKLSMAAFTILPNEKSQRGRATDPGKQKG
jgi:hypothetical protein